MKKYIITYLIFLYCAGVSSAWARNSVLVIQSLRIKPYEQVLNGFKNSVDTTIHRLIISEQKNMNLSDTLDSISPDIILAIGKEALLITKSIRHIPIVYAMVLNPELILSDEKNISGVSMKIPLTKYLTVFKDNMPKLKKLGIVYNPANSGEFMKDSNTISRTNGIELVISTIDSPKDVPSAILNMKDKIDAFWMLPDITVVTPESVEFMLLFSMENNIPVFTFSQKYVEMGAFLSMNIRSFDIGSQAGELAKTILDKTQTGHSANLYAGKASVSTNLVVAKRLGILDTVTCQSPNKIKNRIQSLE